MAQRKSWGKHIKAMKVRLDLFAFVWLLLVAFHAEGINAEVSCNDALFMPICASNNVTFTNFCTFNKAGQRDVGLMIKHQGHCVASSNSSEDSGLAAISWMVGNTTQNETTDSSLSTKCDWKCTHPAKSNLKTNEHTELVCGSNGVEYTSHCELARENCRTEGSIRLAESDEVCKKPTMINDSSHEQAPDCDQVCITLHNPVCASNGQTFSNKCKFDVANCLAKGSLEVLYEESCSCGRHWEEHCNVQEDCMLQAQDGKGWVVTCNGGDLCGGSCSPSERCEPKPLACFVPPCPYIGLCVPIFQDEA